MNAQPSETPGPAREVVRVPRTIRAVREALPAEQRAQFAAEMDVGEQPATFEGWWMRAVVYSSPRTLALLEQARAGALKTVPAEQVFGDRWATA